MTLLTGSKAATRVAELMTKPELSEKGLQELLDLQDQLRRKTAIVIEKKKN